MLFNRTFAGNVGYPYREYIPENYIRQIEEGSIRLVTVFEGDGEKGEFVGLYVTGIHNLWLEVIWIYLSDNDCGIIERSRFLRHAIECEKKRSERKLKGAFFELHTDEADRDMKDVLQLSGMETKVLKNNIYEFSLADVVERETLEKAVKKSVKALIPLSGADEKMLSLLSEKVMKDPRPTPVSVPIPWDQYLQDISLIFLENGSPSGFFLVTEVEDSLVVEAAFSVNPKTLVPMIGKAFFLAEEKYGAKKKVIVPVVVHKVGKLVEKMVKNPYRGDILEGIIRF